MYTILIVDDEVQIMTIIDEFLSKKGYNTIGVSEPLKAIEILKTNTSINMIILDMIMPKMKGLELLKQIKGLGIDIPALILTGTVDLKNYVGDIQELGYSYDDALHKPVDLNKLLEKVQERLT